GSGESYVGYGKATGFASPGGARPDAPSLYRAAPSLALNHWGLSGRWTMGEEFTTLTGAPGAIAFRFHARDLHLVMGPSAPDKPVRFRVRLDGAAPGGDHGTDIDAEGGGRLDQPRMYQLVRQSRPVADRTFEIDFQDPGARAYVFTFG
ncbi:MAG TPA: cytochrome c biogenesis protein DipZ, partial [Phenylobacterium sp.]